MLLQLLPDQIAKFWPYVKYAVEEVALSEGYTQTLSVTNRVLESLIGGTMQAWICVIDDNPETEEPKIVGLVLTGIANDNLVGGGVLRLIVVYGFEAVPPAEYEAGFHVLMGYAKRCDCRRVEGFTNNELLIKMAKAGKFKKDTHLYFDLED